MPTPLENDIEKALKYASNVLTLIGSVEVIKKFGKFLIDKIKSKLDEMESNNAIIEDAGLNSEEGANAAEAIIENAAELELMAAPLEAA